uniref:Uncharacterized protein n=1 Tax=Athene cunicularia TaxID=194338 RepID=A0A663MKG3_ATHCN
MEKPLSWHKGWSWLHSEPHRGRDVPGQEGGTRAGEQALRAEHPWEASFAFGVLSITGISVQFVAAIASLLLCSYCYCSLARIAVTNYPSYTVPFPFPYADFPNLCKGPSHYKWYNLTLQILGLYSSLAVFYTFLGFVMTFARLLQFRHLNNPQK